MIVPRERVVALQRFLLGAARTPTLAGPVAEREILAAAASLDYVILVATERPDDVVDDAAATTASVRTTLVQAIRIALAAVRRLVDAPEAAFVAGHAEARDLLVAVRAFREAYVLHDDAVAFDAIALANDLAERRRSLRER